MMIANTLFPAKAAHAKKKSYLKLIIVVLAVVVFGVLLIIAGCDDNKKNPHVDSSLWSTGKPIENLTSAADTTVNAETTVPPGTVPPETTVSVTTPPVTTPPVTTIPETTEPPVTEPGPVVPVMTLDYAVKNGFIPGSDTERFYTNIKNPEAISVLEELAEFLEEHDLAVYYGELTTGNFFTYNSTEVYDYQSITKAYYANYLYKTLPKSEFTRKLPLTEKARMYANYGGIADFDDGTMLSVSYLIKYSIRISDAAGYNMLFDEFGAEGFNEYAKELGSGLRLTSAYGVGRFSTGTVWDAAVFLQDIWNNRDSYSKELIDHMCNCSYNGLISWGLWDYKVAHKYGYGGEDDGYNDSAIVFTDSPYVLVVLTRLPGSIDVTNYPIRKISADALKINLLLQENK